MFVLPNKIELGFYDLQNEMHTLLFKKFLEYIALKSKWYTGKQVHIYSNVEKKLILLELASFINQQMRISLFCLSEENSKHRL